MQAKKQYSEIKIPYNSAWESVKIDKAIVIDPNGKKYNISKDEINLMDSPWIGSAPRYPAEKILVASLPGVEVGSIIETQITSVIKDRPFYSYTKSFRAVNPSGKITFQLTTPKNVKNKIAEKNS